jgi:hypothetical protein
LNKLSELEKIEEHQIFKDIVNQAYSNADLERLSAEEKAVQILRNSLNVDKMHDYSQKNIKKTLDILDEALIP